MILLNFKPQLGNVINLTNLYGQAPRQIIVKEVYWKIIKTNLDYPGRHYPSQWQARFIKDENNNEYEIHIKEN